MTWSYSSSYLENGQYYIDLIFVKAGTYDDLTFIFTNNVTLESQTVLLANMNTIDAPSIIRVTPGPCDITYPDVTVVTVSDKILVGKT